MKTYITNDITLAAILYVLGGEHLKTETGVQTPAYFIFKGTLELEDLVRNYHQGKTSVEPHEFMEAQTSLLRNVQTPLEDF